MMKSIENGNARDHLMRTILFALLIFSFTAMIISGGDMANAEPGGESGAGYGGNGGDAERIVEYYIDYYIPLVPGMDNCYGAYRVLGQTGTQTVAAEAGIKRIQFSDEIRQMRQNILDEEEKNRMREIKTATGYDEIQNIATLTDIREISRDDVILLTDFSATAQRTRSIHSGNTRHIFHHRFHYEVPRTVLGYVTKMNAATGSIQGRSLVVVDRDIIKKYMPDFTVDHIAAGYQQYKSTPQGAILGINGKHVGSKTGIIPEMVESAIRGRGGHYTILATLAPDTDETMGWWTLFNQTTLRYFDMVRKNPEKYLAEFSAKEQAVLDSMRRDIESQIEELEKRGATPPAIFLRLLDSGLVMDMDPEIINQYHYDNMAWQGSPSQVYSLNMSDPWRALLNPYEMSKTWNTVAADIARSTEKDFQEKNHGQTSQKREVHQFDIRVVPPSKYFPDVLKSLASSSPGAWLAPSVDGNLYSDSIMMLANDPDLMGVWPFSRAQEILYEEFGALSETIDDYSQDRAWEDIGGMHSRRVWSSSSDRDSIIRHMTSRMPAGVFGRLNGVISGRSSDLWNDPWLPGTKGRDNDPWYYWYNKNKSFYLDVVPYMNMQMSLTMMDIPRGIVAWNKGVERQTATKIIDRWSGTAEGIRQTLINKGVLSPNERLIDATGGKLSQYMNRGVLRYHTDSDAVAWIIKNKNKLSGGEGATDMQTSLSYASTSKVVAKYFPVDSEKILGWIQYRFPVVLQAGIKFPDFSTHRSIWEKFGHFDNNSGLNAMPNEWPLPTQYHRAHYEEP